MRLQFGLSLLAVILANQACVAETIPAQELASKSLLPRFAVSKTVDLSITAEGEVHGRAVNQQGKGLPGLEISLLNQHRVIETVNSDSVGQFTFHSVSPGARVVRISDQMQVVRLWDATNSPPGAKPGLLYVTDNATVRGQGHGGFQGHFGGVFQRILRNPWLVGVGTAAAVAIPLATDDDDERPSDFANQLAAPAVDDGDGGESDGEVTGSGTLNTQITGDRVDVADAS